MKKDNNSIKIQDKGIKIFNPDSPAESDIIFDIFFECSTILKYPMKWEVTYVASMHEYDQTLASTIVGPISVGISRFALHADPPKLEELPEDEIGLAALLITAFYNDKEFYRKGYMLYHEKPEDMTKENLDIKKITRHISIDPDDITTMITQINWS